MFSEDVLTTINILLFQPARFTLSDLLETDVPVQLKEVNSYLKHETAHV